MAVIEAIDDPVEPWPPVSQQVGAVERLRADVAAAESEIQRLRAEVAEAEARADHDALTGLLNRRGFDRELARTLASCKRYGGDAALIYLDLDGFKRVNDRFGHAAGDRALVTVAEVLKKGVRESDTVARLGGDEFAVILNHAGRAIANGKARWLVTAVEAADAGPGGPLRLSWGVRTYDHGIEAAQMVAEADAAMFVRKGERRRA